MDIQTLLTDQLKAYFQTEIERIGDPEAFRLEKPSDAKHGDFATNIAMRSARILRRPPIEIAEDFANRIRKAVAEEDSPHRLIERVEVKAPGFINLFVDLKVFYGLLEHVLDRRADWGRQSLGHGKSWNIEFVSANPTGPLSIAHARQAAVGDALGNILSFLGFGITKEYYVNDGGNQIRILARSILYRARAEFGEQIDFPEECYQGDYIRDLAQQYIRLHEITSVADLPEEDALMSYGSEELLKCIQEDLHDFRVNFDVWSRESEVAAPVAIDAMLKILQDEKHLYSRDGALWFRSTEYGDDKDRVVRKSDGSFTYLAPDIVYHKNKFDRGFDRLVNIWGPDHHGYIPRISAAARALGHDAASLEVLIVQLATIYREGKAVSMSTRRGQYISLREVIEEVGVDASRFFFLMRHINAHLDFDLDLAKKETPENPVFYIQYAHARIHSIHAKAEESSIQPLAHGFRGLKESEERALMLQIASFPQALRFCLQQRDPFPLVSYLQEVAASFHKFYDRHRVVDPEQPELSSERLALSDAVRWTLANGLQLLGMTSPEKM